MPATPRVPRSGFISALIVTVGMAGTLGTVFAYAYLRKDVRLVVGGNPRHLTTFTRTVGQLLAEAGVVLGPRDEVDPARAAWVGEGMTINVRRAVPLTIVADGRTFRLESAAPSVGELLQRRGITLGDADRVDPDPAAPLAAGMIVRVIRVEHRVVAERHVIPYGVVRSDDPLAPRGRITVMQPGRAGLKELLYKLTVADGRVVERVQVGGRTVRTALDRVVRVGTFVRIASRGPFTGREYMDMIATGYSPFCCPGVDHITSTGMRAGYGVVAVDPTVIPLGSRLYVEGYGPAVAGDVGGAIKGLRIDLGFDTTRDALRWGRRSVRVFILEIAQRRRG